jgi:hypothetical protein
MAVEARSVLLAHGLLEDPGAVPLMIGVVGHRDPIPAVLPLLALQLRQQLEQLIRELPHTPLVMINGLAEGMDTMAAAVFREVVEADRERRGAATPRHLMVAALPKVPELYATDFNDPEALRTMQEELARCDAVLHPGNCADLRIQAHPDGRAVAADDPACYGQQGIFMVRNCYLLFAFYDGVDTFLVGGTAQTIAMHKGVIHPSFVSVEEVLNKQESGVLVVQHTPRRRPGSPQTQAGAVSFWPDCGAGGIRIPEALLAIPRQIEAINRELCRPGFTASCSSEGVMTRLWSLADRKAQTNKKTYELLCRTLVVLGFVLVLLAQLDQERKAVWWGLLLVAFLVFPRWQERPKQAFISQRCLAECLTVQHLWAASGIDDAAADLFLSRSQSALGWIRSVVRGVRIQLLSRYSHEERDQGQALQRAQQWIDGQVAYLQMSKRRLAHKAERLRIVASLLAVIAIAMALLETISTSAPLKEATGLWVEVFLAGFASVIGYRELMGYQDTMERYSLSLEQFTRGQQALRAIRPLMLQAQPRAFDREKIVVEAIGREKIDELNHWVSDQLQRVYAPGT